ncbi:MAG: restriction endonuclease subunit S [Oscillospiraceae bacterium]
MSKFNTVRLGNVTEVITKGTTPTTIGFEFQEQGINFLKIECISEMGDFLPQKFEHISNECNEKLKRSQLKENDILFSIAGAIGRTAIVTTNVLPANINQALSIIRLNDNRLIHNYVLYALNSDSTLKQFEKQKQGVAQLNISLKNVSDLEIPLPPLEIQQQIAENLDKVTHLIDLCNTILEKLDLLVKSRFTEMFGDFETLIDSWETKCFSDVTLNYDSTRKPVKDADRKKMQGIYPYYGATGIVDYVNDYRIDGEYLLISEDGKALEFRNKNIAFIAQGKIWVNNHAHVIQCKSTMNMIFLMYYMNNRDISLWVTGIDQKKLNRENLDKMPVAVPPIELQTQFAEFVQSVDKSKLAVKKVLEKAETLKKSLMQEYFG